MRYTPTDVRPQDGKATTPERADGIKKMPPEQKTEQQKTPPKESKKVDSAPSQYVWVLDNGKPRAIKVTTGLNDGVNTEVISSELTTQMSVIVGETQIVEGSESTENKNIFMPKMPQRGKR